LLEAAEQAVRKVILVAVAQAGPAGFFQDLQMYLLQRNIG
jgi:hypothetical protein